MPMSSTVAAPDGRSLTLLDTEQFDGLVDAAGVEGVRDILAAFWRSTDGLIVDLNASLVAPDQQAALRAAHALKGSALNVGAVRFADTLRRLELACKEQDFATARRWAETAGADYRDTVEAFEGRLAAAAR